MHNSKDLKYYNTGEIGNLIIITRFTQKQFKNLLSCSI